MLTDEYNVLFTSAGRRVALVRLFRRALAALGLPGRVVTADLKATAPAHFVADASESVPRVSDPRYVGRVLDLCRKHRVRMVVPLIDTELHLLAPHREAFRAAGTTLLVSSPEASQICLDKRETHDFFRKAGIPTPAILDPRAILDNPDAAYPFLLKPARGSASAGVTVVRNARELEFFLDYVPDPIVQELLAGDEYTFDILVDPEGRARCVVPRRRIETRAGEVSKGVTVKAPALLAAARRVAEALPGAFGCLTAQGFLGADGVVRFIEINPRFGGGFPLSAEAGADFPRWLIELDLGRSPEIPFDGWLDGLSMLRYDEAIFTRLGCPTGRDDSWFSTSTTPSTPSARSS